VTHRQQRDFVIEIDEAFDDHAAGTCTAAGLRVIPGFLNVGFALDHALAFAATTSAA
jgi:hypothetical protein